MSKNFLNKNQKRILYKNMGVLAALFAACALLVRCGGLGSGETLADLERKQEQQTSENTETAVPSISGGEPSAEEPPSSEEESSASAGNAEIQPDSAAGLPADGSPVQPENTEYPSETVTEQPQKEEAMDDRTAYQEGFYYESLSDTVKDRITGISYPADDSSAAISYDTLRYVSVLYCDFNGETQQGELICHKAVAQDLVEIFYELYQLQYPIERICLVDEYQGDDSLSMEDNNTSCFNYRALPSGKLSNHAYGLAIDINPFYNPYVTTSKDGTVHITPAGSEIYADREQNFAYKIDKEDPAYQLFIEHGFTWGGSWRSSKDYQHFEKAV